MKSSTFGVGLRIIAMKIEWPRTRLLSEVFTAVLRSLQLTDQCRTFILKDVQPKRLNVRLEKRRRGKKYLPGMKSECFFACINDGVTLKKKFTALELKKPGWMISQNRTKTGKDSINRNDPDVYMTTRLQEDFNSIQLIACSRIFPIIRPDCPATLGFKDYKWPLSPACNCNITTRFLKKITTLFNCTSYTFVSYKII